MVGGLVGFNGNIHGNTYADGAIIDCSYATGAVTATSDSDVGGFVGANTGTAQYSYATGAVTAASGGNVGGFMGENTCVAQNSYYNIDSAQTVNQTAKNPKLDFGKDYTASATVTGLTKEKMTGISAKINMAALDYSSVWFSQKNTDLHWYYPQLQTFVNGNASTKAASLASVTMNAPINTVSAFDALNPTVKTQNVANGTAFSNLNLPDSLNATVNGAAAIIKNITWTSSPAYVPATAGAYTLTPVLPANYAITSGLQLPTITVTVNAESNASHHSSSDSTHNSPAAPSLPALLTDTPTSTTADLSGTTLPSGVTGVSLAVTPETSSGAPVGVSGGAADPQGAAAYNFAVSDKALNAIGALFLYNIKLLDQNGNPITSFTGNVTVKIPVPAGIHGTPHVFRYEESTGTFTDRNATVESGFLVFSTDHFSHYIIAGTGDSIMLDTKSYQMPVNGTYQIGVKLTGSKAATVKFHSTNDKIAAVAKLKNGNYQVTGRSSGTAYIMFDVYDNRNHLLTHASVRVDVKTGVRPRGDSTRQIGVF